MKPQHFLYFLAVVSIFFMACEKKIDYRDKWVGDYIGEYTSWMSSPSIQDSIFIFDTIYDTINQYVVNVSIWKDSCLFFLSGNSSYYGWKPKVNIEGYFLELNDRRMMEGSMVNDSVYFNGGYSESPAVSSGYEFKGKKQ